MNSLESFVASPLANALGWALLHSLWQGVIAAGLLLCVLFITREPRIRYTAACVAMLAMLGAFLFTFIQAYPNAVSAVAAVHLPRGFKGGISLPRAMRGNSGSAALAPWLAPAWIAGVILFYARFAAGYLFVRRLRTRGVCDAPFEWKANFARLCAALKITATVQLLESCFAHTPIVVGHLRPVILMPVGLLAGLPVGQVEALLLHELAHIRRRDYLVNAVQRAVEGLLFYHPAAWWATRVIRTERENCCDDIVTSIRDAHEYATALATLEQNRIDGRYPAVAASGGNLVNRIRRLLYPTTSHLSWPPFLAPLMLVAMIALPAGAWQSQHARPEGDATLAAESPYSKWLNQDAAYIITDAERAAYLKLSTDDERKQFIDQFWERRNPVPGAAVNDFKVEHYRRIGFGNKRFTTTSGAPGWQTDRGRTYILYGPPDELEMHPKGPSYQFATEVWLYRHIEGIGDHVYITFADRSGDGDYRLIPSSKR